MTVDLSVSISRTLLGASTLVLPSARHRFGHIGLGGRQWDRTYAQSPWIDGRVLTSARLQASSINVDLIAIQEEDAPLAGLDSAVDALIDAVSQFAYTFSLAAESDGVTRIYSWACEPADFEVGAVEWSRGLGARVQVLQAVIPCSPRPISGPL